MTTQSSTSVRRRGRRPQARDRVASSRPIGAESELQRPPRQSLHHSLRQSLHHSLRVNPEPVGDDGPVQAEVGVCRDEHQVARSGRRPGRGRTRQSVPSRSPAGPLSERTAQWCRTSARRSSRRGGSREGQTHRPRSATVAARFASMPTVRYGKLFRPSSSAGGYGVHAESVERGWEGVVGRDDVREHVGDVAARVLTQVATRANGPLQLRFLQVDRYNSRYRSSAWLPTAARSPHQDQDPDHFRTSPRWLATPDLFSLGHQGCICCTTSRRRTCWSATRRRGSASSRARKEAPELGFCPSGASRQPHPSQQPTCVGTPGSSHVSRS